MQFWLRLLTDVSLLGAFLLEDLQHNMIPLMDIFLVSDEEHTVQVTKTKKKAKKGKCSKKGKKRRSKDSSNEEAMSVANELQFCNLHDALCTVFHNYFI